MCGLIMMRLYDRRYLSCRYTRKKAFRGNLAAALKEYMVGTSKVIAIISLFAAWFARVFGSMPAGDFCFGWGVVTLLVLLAIMVFLYGWTGVNTLAREPRDGFGSNYWPMEAAGVGTLAVVFLVGLIKAQDTGGSGYTAFLAFSWIAFLSLLALSLQ